MCSELHSGSLMCYEYNIVDSTLNGSRAMQDGYKKTQISTLEMRINKVLLPAFYNQIHATAANPASPQSTSEIIPIQCRAPHAKRVP